jgi:pSer/pThr/pTyr-binding forkhead associated (FHA) protein
VLVRAGSGAELVVDADLISLGRSHENQVVVPDPRASRRHALIQRADDRFWLEDLGSTNGTYHNGARVRERTPLQDGDRIRIGATEFTFHLRPGPTEPGVTTLLQRLGEPAAAPRRSPPA